MNGIRVLIADDDEIARELLCASLESWGYEPVVCTNGQEAVDGLDSDDPPQIAILDWNMPGLSGPEICQQLRARQPESYTFVMLLTNRDDYTDQLTGLESGADDFVTKPFDPRELKLRLRTGVRILKLQKQLEQARDSYRHEAESDELTGLWNRRSLQARLDQEIQETARTGNPFSVIIVDVDCFKQINDSLGHNVGDAALKHVAKCLKLSTRSGDIIGRYGGDEFVLLLPEANITDAKRAAERLRLCVASGELQNNDEPYSVSVSVGVAEIRNQPGMTSDLAVEMADKALYAAKRAGRNCVTCYDRSLVSI